MFAGELLHWLDEPDTARGIRELCEDGEWRLRSYAELADLVFAVAQRLRADGVRPGDVATIALESGPEFVAALFGCLLSGVSASPVALPARLQEQTGYWERLAGILRVARPATVITSPQFATLLRANEPAGLPPVITEIRREDLAGASHLGGVPDTDAPALLQFTSGSSGAPKGVAVSASALTANVTAMRQWLRMTPDDVGASWLPLHHDMGLVGCLLTTMFNGSDLWLMRPADFIRSPLTWLECYQAGRATLAATPTFGLTQVLRRVRAEQIEHLDLSNWRGIILGAEHIAPTVLDAFHRLLAGQGFSDRAYLPAYGLAENTLIVTGLAVTERPRSIHLDRRSLTPGAAVVTGAEDPASSRSLVGCGHPVGGVTVTITDEAGEPVPDGVVGEIVVRGPSLADGYLATDGTRVIQPLTGEDGGFATGDAGVLVDGELFVIGRVGDSLKRRARTLYAEDLEVVLADLPALANARPIVLLGAWEGEDTVVVVARCKPGEWVQDVVGVLDRQTEGLPVMVCVDPHGVALRTSSGKPRRKPMWQALVTGKLDVTTIFDGRARP